MLIQLPFRYRSKIQIVTNETADCESKYHIRVTNVKKSNVDISEAVWAHVIARSIIQWWQGMVIRKRRRCAGRNSDVVGFPPPALRESGRFGRILRLCATDPAPRWHQQAAA